MQEEEEEGEEEETEQFQKGPCTLLWPKIHSSHNLNSVELIKQSEVIELLETHLFVSLYLWVDKCPQYWSHKGQIGEDLLGFLMQTQKREIASHLHGDNCVLLL